MMKRLKDITQKVNSANIQLVKTFENIVNRHIEIMYEYENANFIRNNFVNVLKDKNRISKNSQNDINENSHDIVLSVCHNKLHNSKQNDNNIFKYCVQVTINYYDIDTTDLISGYTNSDLCLDYLRDICRFPYKMEKTKEMYARLMSFVDKSFSFGGLLKIGYDNGDGLSQKIMTNKKYNYRYRFYIDFNTDILGYDVIQNNLNLNEKDLTLISDIKNIFSITNDSIMNKLISTITPLCEKIINSVFSEYIMYCIKRNSFTFNDNEVITLNIQNREYQEVIKEKYVIHYPSDCANQINRLFGISDNNEIMFECFNITNITIKMKPNKLLKIKSELSQKMTSINDILKAVLLDIDKWKCYFTDMIMFWLYINRDRILLNFEKEVMDYRYHLSLSDTKKKNDHYILSIMINTDQIIFSDDVTMYKNTLLKDIVYGSCSPISNYAPTVIKHIDDPDMPNIFDSSKLDYLLDYRKNIFGNLHKYLDANNKTDLYHSFVTIISLDSLVFTPHGLKQINNLLDLDDFGVEYTFYGIRLTPPKSLYDLSTPIF